MAYLAYLKKHKRKNPYWKGTIYSVVTAPKKLCPDLSCKNDNINHNNSFCTDYQNGQSFQERSGCKGNIYSEFKASKKLCPDVSCPTGHSDHNLSFQAESDNQNGQSFQGEERDNKTGCMDHLYGDHETQVSEGGEADLHKHLIGCKKNPGHRQFIPVDTFTLNHLPEGHRDNDLFKLIKATADVTVRVNVTMTSPHRPEFWSDTKVSYPFYNMGGKTNLRTGSGILNYVNMFTDGYSDRDGIKCRGNYTTCWCTKCKHSDTASHVWWEFNVHTATHVVFDDIEALHTSLRLFYDREDSPVVSVDQVSVYDVNIERDLCSLKCVTCDKNLADKLDKLWRHYWRVWFNVYLKYRVSPDVDKLNFIVSHPHGCSKQVSVGHWVDKYEEGDGYNKFTYTTCTCRGSSGASVHCVGYTGGGGVYFFVHSGSLNSKLNYSGTGRVW